MNFKTLCTLLLLGASTSALAKEVRTLKVDDTSTFPKVRVYLEVPEDGWKDGDATVTFDITEDKDRDEALKWANENPEAIDKKVPPIVTQSNAVVLTFDKQDNDPAEGRMLVFLVDGSTSMTKQLVWNPRKKDEYGRPMAPVVSGLIYEIFKSLNPNDKIGMTGFGGVSLEVLPPTSVTKDNQKKIIEAIRGVPERSARTLPDLHTLPDLPEWLKDIRQHEKSRIYEAIAEVIQGPIKNDELPELPGRRFFFLLSDGDDYGSQLEHSQLPRLFDELKSEDKRPVVFTIFLGREGRKGQAVLKQFACFADKCTRFMSHPTPEELAKAFTEASEPLKRQLLIEFEVPGYFHTNTAWKAKIALKSKDADSTTIPLNLRFSKISEELATKQKQYAADIEEVKQIWRADLKQTEQLKWGAGIVLLLVIVGVFIWRIGEKKKQEEWNRAEKRRGELEDQSHQARVIAQEIMQNQADAAKVAAVANRNPIGILMGTDGPLKGQRYAFFKPRVLVGRDPDRCDVVFPSQNGDMAISRVHAEFSMSGGGWQVRSLSNGGLRVGNSALKKNDAYAVAFGDHILIGKTRFIFQAP